MSSFSSSFASSSPSSSYPTADNGKTNGNVESSRAQVPPPMTAARDSWEQQPLHGESAGSPPLKESEANSFTPSGSPGAGAIGNLEKDQSVHEIFRSARSSSGGSPNPQGDLMPVELDSPVTEEGLPRVTTAQELNTEQPPPIPATALPGTPSVVRDTSDEKEETETSGIPAATANSETSTEISVVASAPGKVIVFGEHAVVYGKTAVGAAVSDLRVVTTAGCTSEASLVIKLPDLDVCFRRTSDDVATYFDSAIATTAKLASDTAPAPPTPAHLDLISVFIGDDWAEDKRKAILPLVFLALAIVPGIFVGKFGPAARGLSITAFSASLPVGAGLGSSAALCVATSAALTRLACLLSQGNDGRSDVGHPRMLHLSTEATERGGTNTTAAAEAASMAAGGGAQSGRGSRPSRSELELINAWAFAGETVLHGTPSGLDNTVSCYGGAIKFIKGMGGAGNVTEPIPGFPPLSIILTNTRVPKDTRALVAGVRRLLNAHPGPIAKTFDAIGAIASEFLERAAASVKSGGASAAAPAEGVLEDGNEGMPLTAECVGELAEMNHRLLCTLGVGHPALERVCEVARAYGCKTKLTGAGGGGCALTIISGDKSLSKGSIVRDMESEGFECYQTSLGGDGVLWHGGSVPPEFQAVEKKKKCVQSGDGELIGGGVRGGVERNDGETRC